MEQQEENATVPRAGRPKNAGLTDQQLRALTLEAARIGEDGGVVFAQPAKTIADLVAASESAVRHAQ
jgi:hypothetical protein